MGVAVAVLFDVDGTLVDHDRAQREGLRLLLADDGDELDEFRWRRWRELEEQHFARYLAGELGFQEQRRQRVKDFTGRTLTSVQADAWFDAYLVHFEASWQVFDDVEPTLTALGDRPLAAFSNVSGEFTRHKLAQVGLLDRLVVAWGLDDVGAAKPDPRPFLALCDHLGVEPARTVHVGDRYGPDALGARDAGLRGVWLDRPGADPVGRRPTGDPDPEVPVVSSLRGLLPLLER